MNRTIEVAKETLRIEANSLLDAMDRVGEGFLKGVEIIYSS